MQLITTVITNSSVFFDLHQEWHYLLENSVVNEIFLTPEYQSVWWQTLGRGELHIISVRSDSGTLVGLAPLFVDDGVYNFIGCKDVSDYLDFIVHKNYKELVYQVLFDELKSINQASYSLCSIQKDSPTLIQLPKLFSGKEKLSTTEQAVCPQIQLPNTWDSYLNNLNRKQRQEIKRKWKKIETSEDVEYQCISEEHAATQAVSLFIELHQQSSETKRDFWDPHHKAFFEQLLPVLARRGWLKLFFLSIGRHTKPIAAMLIFDYGGHYDLYNSGFNPDFSSLSPGQVLTAYTIKDAIENGRTLYDFLRGNEEYKFRLGGIPKPIYDLSFSIK
ncbi:MAG TPA: GNAT family N-acetyltransferase [Candidatus Woesebacteria bacterium]|nr:GNAT family N-acetyltransferase [Candidatus Woesebacteria bacterium]HNS65556.1 GNAT family N-acetyltransferase [Candidatus Woesebacteria bacterium]